MTKYTDWFPPEIKPVHVGVYEIETYENIGKSFFDGNRFGMVTWANDGEDDVSVCARAASEHYVGEYSCAGLCRWRGLSEKPKGE